MLSPYLESDQKLELVSACVTGSCSPKRAALDLSTFDQFILLIDGFFIRFLNTVFSSAHGIIQNM